MVSKDDRYNIQESPQVQVSVHYNFKYEGSRIEGKGRQQWHSDERNTNIYSSSPSSSSWMGCRKA
jgi:hypothetical protein